MKPTINLASRGLVRLEELSEATRALCIEKLGYPNGAQRTDIPTDAQSSLETDIFDCASDTYKTQTQGSESPRHGRYPQSAFEMFCAAYKIDPLTLDKKGQKRIAKDFAAYRNVRIRGFGGGRISQYQGYAAVRDYIRWKQWCFCN